MATDVENTVERVFYRVAPKLSESQAGVYRFEIESMIDNGLQRLGDKVADTADYAVLQKTFSVTLSAGIGILTSAVVVRSIQKNGDVIVTGDSFSAQYYPWKQDLELGSRPAFFKYYTVRGQGSTGGGTILVYDGTGAPVSGSATVRANYYPARSGSSLSDLPTQMQDELVDILVSMVQEKLSGAPNVTPESTALSQGV